MARSLAFSIVELLSVVAIVAVISAVLLPVVFHAREGAYRATAIGNAHQVVSAQLLYEADNDERFVLYFSGLVSAGPKGRVYGPPLSYWPQTITPYLGVVRITQGSQEDLVQDLPRVFLDPVKGFKPQDPLTWPFGNISSWGMSDDIVQWVCPQPTFVSINPSSVVSPSECVLLAETWDFYSPSHDLAGSAIAGSYFDPFRGSRNSATAYLDSPYAATYPKQGADQEPDPNGRNITVFCDGHAKAILTGQLTGSGNYWSVSHTDAWP